MKNEELKKRVIDTLYMDDLNIPLYSPDEDSDEMIKETSAALAAGSFEVKSWVRSGDKAPSQKYLSYNYFPENDVIKLRLKINLSKRRRGIRLENDLLNYEEFEEKVKRNGLTKRMVASLLASAYHDPLHLAGPYTATMKIIYRKVCSETKSWDEKIPAEMENLMLKTAANLFKLDQVSMPRTAFVYGAASYKIKVYWDASEEVNAVSIVIASIFKDGTVTNRILLNKLKLNSKSASTMVRKELSAAHMASRVLEIILHFLEDFLKNKDYQLEMIGDSSIVLAQIMSLPFLYKSWSGTRLHEIQELTSGKNVTFYHCPSQANIADINTRVFTDQPENIPWWGKPSLEIDESVYKSPKMQKLEELPDTKKQDIHISVQNSLKIKPGVEASSAPGIRLPLIQLLSVATPLERKTEVIESAHISFDIVDELLKRKSYEKTVRILARVLQWSPRNKNETFIQCQEMATDIIFCCYQNQNIKYIMDFGGNLFSKISSTDDLKTDPCKLQVRENNLGPEFLRLAPKKTLLFSKLIEAIHCQDHASDGYCRLRSLRQGFYIPTALIYFGKYRRSCPVCRKKANKKLVIKMGYVGENRSPKSRNFMESMVSDYCGPFKMKSVTNERTKTKFWLMLNTCNYTRFVTLTLVESLSKESLLKAILKHRNRWGFTSEIFSDYGSNYTSAAKAMMEESEEVVDKDVMEQVKNSLKRYSVTMRLRCPKNSWAQGSAERMIQVVKKLWPKDTVLKWHETDFLIEEIMKKINDRPLTLSTSMKSLCPNDLRPCFNHGESKSADFQLMYGDLQKTIQRFHENFDETYAASLIAMKKWLQDSHTLQPGDLVCLSDITGRNQLALVDSIREDQNNHPRYFTLKYVSNGKVKKIERPGPSLTLILTEEELRDGVIRDPLSFGNPNAQMQKKKKLKVMVPRLAEKILDIK